MNALRDDELDAVTAHVAAALSSRMPSSLEMRLSMGVEAPLSIPELARMLRRSEATIAQAVAPLQPYIGGRPRLYRYRDVVAALQCAAEPRPGEAPPSAPGRTARGGRKGGQGPRRWDL